jgi:hypothetical protein
MKVSLLLQYGAHIYITAIVRRGLVQDVYSDAHARLLRKYGEFDGFQAPAEHDRAAAADDDDLIEFENEDDFIDVI